MLRRLWIVFLILAIAAGCNMPQPGATQPQPTQEVAELTPESLAGTPEAATASATGVASQPLEPATTLQPPEKPSGDPSLTNTPLAAEGEAGRSAQSPEALAGVETSNEAGEDPVLSFTLQPGTPTYMGNFVEPESGCEWMGVAGQVFGSDGKPLTQVIVEVSGVLDGEEVLALGLTGAAQTLGPGGYLIHVSDQPVDSTGQLNVVVRDLGGNTLSTPTSIDTFGGCEKNLILVNFVSEDHESPGKWKQFLPFVGNQN